ncbi:DNA mismatch repair protein MutS [Nonlabens sp. Hel1_33_55]|uniref:DNA mismatch repair protein MutS n=1 Tax=Nonlabens sp. Hel1_33_55 TaxID=1336802 RepID=UPI000875C80B|nr:DNA mismatch repair protein MutS [Nonlabens sp. Hel1_33_55]SCY37568.1 DNA mismatch repair protein MutS [Nonlabens sp. Hel1_33_55]
MAAKSKKVTPLMQQYNKIKVKYPDALLLFRVGDFYETFGEDAVKTARILNIVLTNRNNGGERTELAGFPHHSLNTYLPKLVRAGERVAICDQLEDPKATKSIVKRGVTELITPGVSLNDEVLQAGSNNFLASISLSRNVYAVAFLDISTGEFLISQGTREEADKLLQNFNPSEVLVSRSDKKQLAQDFPYDLPFFFLEDWVFQIDYARESLLKHFKVNSLKGYGVEKLDQALISAGAILHYLAETQHNQIDHIATISRIEDDSFVWMDRFTVRNLELYQALSTGAVTLIDVIDQTTTSMGARLLKRWMAFPLKNADQIKKRHDVVAYFKENLQVREAIKLELKSMNDLERLVSKVAVGKICPREVIQLKNSLQAIAPIKNLAMEAPDSSLQTLGESLNNCTHLIEMIQERLDEDAPVNILKGKTIAFGYNEELDDLRGLATSGKDYLDKMLDRHSKETGISSLKISSNNVFGYYIEVRNSHKDKVPETWTRKQTLVNAERYITEELKEYEGKILGAEERINALQQELYEKVVQEIIPFIKAIQNNAHLIGQLDCLLSFADHAVTSNYTRPELLETDELIIKGGRHPVIEKMLPVDQPYIPNDVQLDREEQQIIMITGPNMSGKSAILRQTALIVLLAQIGSFVPADEVKMGIVDKIFTRVGASDNISQGESTFMTEMNESASILNNVSDRSLILLDEIGRGTSTYDGISIAWAITEYLHEHPFKAKTLFATHYHELNEMTEQFLRIKNFNVEVKELKDKVLFMRKLIPGGSHHSFGIHVAKMAGMPQQVIHKAKKMLKTLEKSHQREDSKAAMKAVQDEEMQLSFFNLDDPLLEEVRNEIIQVDINTLTPVEALMKLNEIKRMLIGKDKATG